MPVEKQENYAEIFNGQAAKPEARNSRLTFNLKIMSYADDARRRAQREAEEAHKSARKAQEAADRARQAAEEAKREEARRRR